MKDKLRHRITKVLQWH